MKLKRTRLGAPNFCFIIMDRLHIDTQPNDEYISNMNPLIELNDDKIRTILTPELALNTVEKGFRKKGQELVNLPPKSGPSLDTPGAFCDSMTASVFKRSGSKKILDAFGIKWISVFNENQKKGLPVINGLIILNDPETGLPTAILNANYITGIRTAAVSGVCAKYLSPQKNKLTIGIFGLGLQAELHIAVFKTLYKDAEFIIFEHSKHSGQRFRSTFEKEKFLYTNDHHELVGHSDIILSLTTFPEKITPYIFAEDLKDDVLILPVDYGSRVDSSVYSILDESYTDDIGQYSYKTKTTPYFSENSPKIKKEVGHLLANHYKRSDENRKILVFNLGIALFDVLSAQAFVESRGLD